MRIEVAGSTHVGMKRAHNEDNFLLLPEERLCVVADGMGGHASGEVASLLAVQELEAFFRATSGGREITWQFQLDDSRPYDENRLVTGIKQANQKIWERSQSEPSSRGMGTTVVSLFFAPGTCYLGWAGDSRGYRLRHGELVLLSEDHSLLNDLLKAKKLGPGDVEAFPHKNVIVRALGMKNAVEVDVVQDVPEHGDVYLLCSDGLSGMVSDATIAKILNRTGDLERAVNQLIDMANAAGGQDNVTVVLARFLAG